MRGFRIYDNTKKRYVTEDVSWVVTPDGMCSELDGGDLIGYPDCVKEDETSLTDKNNNKIFEGDILKIISSTKDGEREDLAIVMSDDKNACYKLKVYNNGKYKRISNFTDINLWCYKAKVVGNLHDNKELLEVNNESCND